LLFVQRIQCCLCFQRNESSINVFVVLFKDAKVRILTDLITEQIAFN